MCAVCVSGADRRRVLELEWSDPPYLGGHWVPEMVEAAGGTVLAGPAGGAVAPGAWADIAGGGGRGGGLRPLRLRAGPGGGRGDRAPATGPSWPAPGRCGPLDGSAYFSRPGPRVVDGVEALAWVLHPRLVPPPPPGRARRLR